jgi:sec-independent protein translocase protein TatC
MATALRPVGHEDRLTLVEHLGELRTRLFVCLAAFLAAFGVCFWQNDAVLEFMDRPLEQVSVSNNSDDPLEQSALFQRQVARSLSEAAPLLRDLGRQADDPALAAEAERTARAFEAVGRSAPTAIPRRPVTLGVGEPFTATFKVAAYAALLLAMPILLYQTYAFVLPAFSPREREVALPLMLAVPFLFIAGVVFSYLLILPAAIDFLQNFNDDNFDILLQARDYYGFSIMLLGLMGLLFQIPIGVLAVTRVGIVSTTQLRRNRRYAILVIAILAMLLPGTDPITMMLLMSPLIVLYEGSILFATLLDRRAERLRRREEAEEDDDRDAEPLPTDQPKD